MRMHARVLDIADDPRSDGRVPATLPACFAADAVALAAPCQPPLPDHRAVGEASSAIVTAAAPASKSASQCSSARRRDASTPIGSDAIIADTIKVSGTPSPTADCAFIYGVNFATAGERQWYENVGTRHDPSPHPGPSEAIGPVYESAHLEAVHSALAVGYTSPSRARASVQVATVAQARPHRAGSPRVRSPIEGSGGPDRGPTRQNLLATSVRQPAAALSHSAAGARRRRPPATRQSRSPSD